MPTTPAQPTWKARILGLCWWWCGWLVGIVVVLLLLAEIALIGVNHWAMSKLRPIDRQLLHEYVTVPFSVPPEWRNPKPWSKALVSARDEWARLRRDPGEYSGESTLGCDIGSFVEGIEETGVLDKDDLTSIDLYLKDQSAGHAAARRLLETPGFNYDCLYVPPPGPVPYYNLECDHKGLVLGAYLQAARGDWAGGTSTALHLLKLAAASRNNSLCFGRYRDFAGVPAFALAWMATSCPDPSLSRTILEEMDAVRIDPLTGTLTRLNSGLYFIYVEELRGMAQTGFAVDFSKSVTGLELEEHLRNTREAYSQWMLAKMAPSDIAREQVKRYGRTGLLDEADWLDNHALVSLARSHSRLQELIYLRGLSWYIGHIGLAWKEPDLWQIYLDLARLHVATELFRRDQGRLPQSSAELAPQYFKSEPIDPATGQPYVWDASKGQFHCGRLQYFDKLYRRIPCGWGII